jgi:flagellar hook-associated protein 2
MSTISPSSTFTGSSSFGPDLQNALNRAISIASLPIQQMTADKQKFDDRATELGTLSGLFTTLQTSLQSLASGSGSKVLAASVSDPTILQASITGSPLQGSYTIQVLNPGSSSSALSNAGPTPVTDPSSQNISSSTSFTLTVGSNTYTITPGGQSLNALAESINSSGAPVQATVINLGSPSAPDYRLALQDTNLGSDALQLNDGTNNLLTTTATGTNASYTVNGQPPGGISSNSRTVTIAPGLNVSLEKAGTSTVTVAGNTTSISNSLNAFVTAYNAVVAEVQKQHGQNAGPLVGDSSVLAMESSLRQLADYSGSSGSINSLSQLGLQFTKTGTLTFDPTALSGLSSQQISDAISFLGDPNAGGYLQFATNTLNSLMDPTTGLLPTEQQSLQAQSTKEAQAINDAQDRVTQLGNNLMAQMAAADALISKLQSQTQFIVGLFQLPTQNSNGTFSTNSSGG